MILHLETPILPHCAALYTASQHSTPEMGSDCDIEIIGVFGHLSGAERTIIRSEVAPSESMVIINRYWRGIKTFKQTIV